MTRTAIRLAAIAALATACWTPAALAETKAVIHDINMETFVDNCEDMGGTAIEGESFAGCDLPSGTSVVCSFEPGGATGGLCEAETRVASTSLKELLGGVLPNLSVGGNSLSSGSSSSTNSGDSGGSTTVSSTSNSDGGGNSPGGGGGGDTGGGKGDHAASSDPGPSTVSAGEDPGPVVK
jgi:hypothetical protein